MEKFFFKERGFFLRDTECFTDLDKLYLIKFALGGLVLDSSPFSKLPQLP